MLVKHTSKKVHRRGKRKSVQVKQQLFSAIGVNVNGIRGKWSTLKNVITKIKPLVWNIQETKCINEGGLKLKGYTVFEHIRSSQNGGGGLAMGCSINLSPILTRIGGDEAEALSVDIKLQKVNILMCTAYGPQNNDLSDKKDGFWKYLNEEAQKAKNDGKGFILQGDLNAWVGSDTIPHDPRPQNDNGRRFKTFPKENNLTVVNALDCCEGLITRTRSSLGQVQNSIIDFFVVCERVLPHVTKMIIDNNRQYTLTNYKGAKHGKKAVDSDHMMLCITINLNITPQKPQRLQLFDFKNKNGQVLFKKLTSETKQFTNCFK